MEGKFSLRNELFDLIDLQVDKFINRLVKKFDLNKEELLTIWKEKEYEEKRVEKGNEKVTSICTYISNSGESCKTRVRNGGILCSKHRSKSDKTNKKSNIKLEPKVEPVNKSKILIMHKKLKKYYHPETGFILSQKKKKLL